MFIHLMFTSHCTPFFSIQVKRSDLPSVGTSELSVVVNVNLPLFGHQFPLQIYACTNLNCVSDGLALDTKNISLIQWYMWLPTHAKDKIGEAAANKPSNANRVLLNFPWHLLYSTMN